VVTAEHERQKAVLDRMRYILRDPLTGLLDLRQKANSLVAYCARLRYRRLHIAPVEAPAAERLDPRLEPCVPDRRGAHVHPAATRAEVEPGPDYRDRLRGLLSTHVGKASVALS
jgi:hypothetical protein